MVARQRAAAVAVCSPDLQRALHSSRDRANVWTPVWEAARVAVTTEVFKLWRGRKNPPSDLAPVPETTGRWPRELLTAGERLAAFVAAPI